MDKRTIEVLGHQMAYLEEGAGTPIVLLHGNPTSSFLWRSVIPHLAPLGRCIAPDLIGMGDSDKLEGSGHGSYRFVEHRRYLDAFLDAVGVTDPVTLVLHDWGSALGFDWAARHPEAVTAIAYMEAIVCPVTWDDWPDAARDIFQAFRSPAGEELILERNLFVEAVLPASIQRQLCRSWPNQTEITVPGIHFIQEDSGDQIGAAIASWLDAPRRGGGLPRLRRTLRIASVDAEAVPRRIGWPTALSLASPLLAPQARQLVASPSVGSPSRRRLEASRVPESCRRPQRSQP
jgi:pimeloyl-ACP methyl ester carboxylesterase